MEEPAWGLGGAHGDHKKIMGIPLRVLYDVTDALSSLAHPLSPKPYIPSNFPIKPNKGPKARLRKTHGRPSMKP